MTDPRYTDPQPNGPVFARKKDAGGIWGWVTGLAILTLIAFVVIAGWNADRTEYQATTTAKTQEAKAPVVRECKPPEEVGNGIFFFECTDSITFFQTLAKFKGEQWEKGMRMVGMDVTIIRNIQVAVFEPRR